jgi:F0F1-type ATP synthase assembly protein I
MKNYIVGYMILILISSILGILLSQIFNFSPLICGLIIGFVVYIYCKINNHEQNYGN